MADRPNVARLFALPYFTEQFDQMVDPMADKMAQIICAEVTDDPMLVIRVTEEARRYIFQSVTELAMNVYCDVLNDEDAKDLLEFYQDPSFIKLTSSLQSMVPMMSSWFEENQELIQRSVKLAVDEAA